MRFFYMSIQICVCAIEFFTFGARFVVNLFMNPFYVVINISYIFEAMQTLH